MSLNRPLLRVLPNPYHTFDGQGRPSCAVHFEPSDQPVDDRRWVGVERLEVEILDSFPAGDLRSNRQDTQFIFAEDTVVQLPVTGYYLAAIREGSLLAADAETAERAGVPFVEPMRKRDESRKASEANWRAHTGRDLPSSSSSSSHVRSGSVRPPSH